MFKKQTDRIKQTVLCPCGSLSQHSSPVLPHFLTFSGSSPCILILRKGVIWVCGAGISLGYHLPCSVIPRCWAFLNHASLSFFRFYIMLCLSSLIISHCLNYFLRKKTVSFFQLNPAITFFPSLPLVCGLLQFCSLEQTLFLLFLSQTFVLTFFFEFLTM